jgi:predicted DCC family thiol-disulfide oxidoreductase YuxK
MRTINSFPFTLAESRSVLANMDEQQAKADLTVYYDGLCKVCSYEMNHYRSQKGSHRLKFVDITDPSFEAKKEGLDPLAVHKVMHVKRRDGELFTKVDAFIEIWSVLPEYQWLTKICGLGPIKVLLNLGYLVFAKFRRFLPKHKKLCEDSPYCDTKEEKNL